MIQSTFKHLTQRLLNVYLYFHFKLLCNIDINRVNQLYLQLPYIPTAHSSKRFGRFSYYFFSLTKTTRALSLCKKKTQSNDFAVVQRTVC